MGHTKIGITLDLYTEVTTTIDEKAVTALDEMHANLKFLKAQNANGTFSALISKKIKSAL